MTENIVTAARAQLGLSQQALADRLGVRQPTVSRWERMTSIPALARFGIERLLAEAEAQRAGQSD